jgi:uncharacterized membrane protein YoaK (UPF0700 family)
MVMDYPSNNPFCVTNMTLSHIEITEKNTQMYVLKRLTYIFFIHGWCHFARKHIEKYVE